MCDKSSRVLRSLVANNLVDHSWGEGLGVQRLGVLIKKSFLFSTISAPLPFQGCPVPPSPPAPYPTPYPHCIQISVPTLINYPIRDAVFSGLVVFVNGVELHRSPLPTLVHRSALRYRQNLPAQQITLHFGLGAQTQFQNNKLTWGMGSRPGRGSKALGSKVKYAVRKAKTSSHVRGLPLLCSMRSSSYNQLTVRVLRYRTE